MRNLNTNEVESVSGGDWRFAFDFQVVEGEISGDESIQEIAAAASNYATGAYWAARDAMADFYERVANSVAYDLGCGGGGGR